MNLICTYQKKVPAAKFTKFCPTWMAILLGSKIPGYTVAKSILGNAKLLFSLS